MLNSWLGSEVESGSSAKKSLASESPACCKVSVGTSLGLAVLFSVHANMLQLYHVLAKHSHSLVGLLLIFGEQDGDDGERRAKS